MAIFAFAAAVPAISARRLGRGAVCSSGVTSQPAVRLPAICASANGAAPETASLKEDTAEAVASVAAADSVAAPDVASAAQANGDKDGAAAPRGAPRTRASKTRRGRGGGGRKQAPAEGAQDEGAQPARRGGRGGGAGRGPGRGAAGRGAGAPAVVAPGEAERAKASNLGRAPDPAFLEAMHDAADVKTWVTLVHDRDMARSANELGSALAALRRINRTTQPRFGAYMLSTLAKFLHITKSEMDSWPPRSLANVVMSLVSLRAADKVLMSKVSATVCRQIAQRANSFKLVELAQLCWACKEMKFRNARLMDAIATGIAAAPRREINPASVTNLLSYISSLEYMNPTTMDQLLDHCIFDAADGMTPAMYEKAFTACSRLHYLDGSNKLKRLQDNLLRTRVSRVNSMDAITILLALLRVRALKPSTLAYLQPVVLQIQEQNRLTRGQLQMLNEISVRLEKQEHESLGLPADLQARVTAAGADNPAAVGGISAEVRRVLQKDLHLDIQTAVTSCGFSIPILVGGKYAVIVTSRLHYMTNDANMLGGISQLLESTLLEDGYKIVWLPMSPNGKQRQAEVEDLAWGTGDAEQKRRQVEYLKSILPAEVLALTA